MCGGGNITVHSIQRELQQSGFDLCHPIHTSWYNDRIKDEGLVENGTLETLPEPSAMLDNGEHTIHNALLIGNSKNVWPVFLTWLAAKVERNRNCADEESIASVISPFDTFVEEAITQALQRCCGDCPELEYEAFWSNGKRQTLSTDQCGDSANSDDARADHNDHCYKDGAQSFLVSMQRVATATGHYWNDVDATKLCVHPEYGTWTAFRTVVVFGTRCQRGSTPPAPTPCPCPLAAEEMARAKTVFDYALKMSSSDEHGYGTTLDKSWEELCVYLHGTVCSGSNWEHVPATMKPWIQLRDCISLGRIEWKYTSAQLLYHYTKDPEILRTELERIGGVLSC